MTDPVDTDAIRNRIATSDAPEGDCVRDVAALLEEVDRLRCELNASMTMHEQARLLAGSALDERNRLRGVIENAPHDSQDGLGCGADFDPIAYPCSCWKADSL